MGRNRNEERDLKAVADALGVPLAEVRKAVRSFFGVIAADARSLSLDNGRKIYTKDVFNEFGTTRNIPSIGRMGPVYSRYLRWRENESKTMVQEPRSLYRKGITQSEIENMAGDILAGKTPAPLRRKRGNEMYDRVWLVGRNGKRLARQVIPKTKEEDV